MTRLARLCATAATLAFAASPALAQTSGVYANGGLDVFTNDSIMLSGRAGYALNTWISVEGQAGLGVANGDGDAFSAFEYEEGAFAPTRRLTGSARFDVDSSFGAFARARFPIANGFEAFARGGYHATQATFRTARTTLIEGITVTDLPETKTAVNAVGFAVGAGLQLMLGERNGVRVDYTYLHVGDDNEVFVQPIDLTVDLGDGGYNTLSVAYVRRF